MSTRELTVMRFGWLGIGAVALLAAGCAGLSSGKPPIRLTGSQEVPPVATTASGTADISVDSFRCPSAASSSNCPTLVGTVTTSGMTGTVAEIHQGAPGGNGPRIVSLTKIGNDTWAVPSGTTLSDAQNDAYWAGRLYVTVASPAHANGEIRAQLAP